MKTKFSKYIGDLCRTILILSIAVLVCIIMQQADANSTNATMIMVLAVLLVARFTDGYLWGILTSIVTVIAVNYLFTYPYYHFNLTISGYLLTFVVNLSISLIVSVMNTRIKQQETMRISAERERLRTDLFRAVSHDLRTPLTSIVGSTGVILENDLDAAKQRELISDVNTDAQWLLRMVENLLAVTRVSNSAQPLKMQPEIIEDVVAEAVIKFSKRFEGFEVAMDPPDDIYFADMEPMLIGQVVTNLLENAAYHSEKADLINISIVKKDRFIEVMVADNGVGIPESRLGSIFTENDVSAKRRGADSRKGMGIGLSVCMSIVKAHGGSMKAANAPSGGAVFTFTLPLKEIDYDNERTYSDN